MNKHLIYSAAVAACALLGGCASEPTCDYSDAPYLNSGSVPSLQAPDGLSAPDHAASLVVPPAPPGEKPPGEGACLDRPPSYFATNQNNETPAAKDIPAQ